MTYKQGDQILYVPSHIAESGVDAHDCDNWGYPNGIQPGFIMNESREKGHWFCRYWSFDGDGKMRIPPTLRTLANSERCSEDFLVKHNSLPPVFVDAAITNIKKDLEAWEKF